MFSLLELEIVLTLNGPTIKSIKDRVTFTHPPFNLLIKFGLVVKLTKTTFPFGYKGQHPPSLCLLHPFVERGIRVSFIFRMFPLFACLEKNSSTSWPSPSLSPICNRNLGRCPKKSLPP